MSFIDKLKKRVEEVADQTKLSIQENLATEEVAQRRIEICNACPSLIQLTKTCKECGCFMTLKTKLKTKECPLGKW